MTSMDHRVESPGTTREQLPLLASRRDAFEQLTERRLDRAYRLAATILDADVEAQDAVHDAAVHAWTRWATLRDQARFDAWFDRIVVNTCRDRLRRNATSSRKVAELTLPSEADPGDRVGQFDALRRSVSTLSVEHKIVVVLRFLEDLPVEEIAARTGLRVGTVKSRLHYALRELRAAYDAAQRSGEIDP